MNMHACISTIFIHKCIERQQYIIVYTWHVNRNMSADPDHLEIIALRKIYIQAVRLISFFLQMSGSLVILVIA